MKITSSLLLVLLLLLNTSVVAQTKTATSSSDLSPTLSTEEKQIENFKEKIATKVAELRKKDQKAVAGFVTTANPNVQIKTDNDDTYIIKIDDSLTNVYQITATGKKEMKASDIEKGAYIIVSGPLLDKTINANVIYQDEDFISKSGKITEVNRDDDTLKIVSSEKDNYTLDIGAKVKILIMNSKTLELEPGTLAKVKEGDTLQFVFKKTGKEKEPNRFDAFKLLVIPQEYFDLSAKVKTSTPSPSVTPKK